MPSLGDILYRGSSVWGRLAANSTSINKFLRSVSSGAPSWEQVDVTDLSNYDAGNFTPSLLFGGGSTGLSYSTQSGKYKVFAGLVICYIELRLSAKGSSTGAATISGLPFNGTINAPPVIRYANMSSMTGLYATGFVNGTTITLEQASTTGVSGLADTNFNNNSVMLAMVTYFR